MRSRKRVEIMVTWSTLFFDNNPKNSVSKNPKSKIIREWITPPKYVQKKKKETKFCKVHLPIFWSGTRNMTNFFSSLRKLSESQSLMFIHKSDAEPNQSYFFSQNWHKTTIFNISTIYKTKSYMIKCTVCKKKENRQ